MYLQTVDEIQDAVARRRQRAPEIRARLKSWAQERYGIADYCRVLDRHLRQPPPDESETVAVLARQLASVSVEDVAFHALCQGLGLRPATLLFLADTFTTRSLDKLLRLKLPWFHWSKKDHRVLEYEALPSSPIGTLIGQPLKLIQTKHGVNVAEYHATLRRSWLGGKTLGDYYDVSALQSELLEISTKPPSQVYRQDGLTGRQVPYIRGAMGDHSLLRPPSKWYYPLYLSWFLDGSFLLFETYENPEGEVGEIKKIFVQAYKRLEDELGLKPLVVEIPPLTKELLSCHKVLVAEGRGVNGWRPDYSQGTVCRMMAKLADEVLNWSHLTQMPVSLSPGDLSREAV